MAIASGPDIVEDGLVLYLDAANERSYPGSGTTWSDLVGSNNATLINGPTYNSAENGSIVFDGVNDFATLPADLGYTTTLSAFGWFKQLATAPFDYHIVLGDFECEITVWDAGGGMLRVGIRDDITNSRYVSDHSSGINDGNWHYIGFTFAGTTKTAYKDGVNVGTQTIPSGFVLRTSFNRQIGRFTSSYYGEKEISEVQVYNKELTAAEVLQNFNAMRDRYGI